MSDFVKIIKNNTMSEKVWGGVVLAPDESYTIPKSSWVAWADNIVIEDAIINGDLIVNNGIDDLDIDLGLVHIKSGLRFIHNDISLLPAVGEDAPSLVVVPNGVNIAQEMEINNCIFGQTRVDNIVGNFVEIQLHMAIDNNVSDRWIQFDVKYFTTNGVNDGKQINTPDGIVTMGPVLVPTIPYSVFQSVVQIPTEQFNSGENYLFFCAKRVVVTDKIAPANNPLVLRYCKRYYTSDSL